MSAAVTLASLLRTSGGRARAQPGGPGAQALVLAGANGRALAAAVAGEVRVRTGARVALLALWEPHATALPALPATSAARHLADRLARRHLHCAPRGKLACLALPADPAAAMRDALRAFAAVDVPRVLAVCGPRPAAVEEMLEEFDLVFVATDGGAASALAVAQLDAAGVGAVACPSPIEGARLAALSGWGRMSRSESPEEPLRSLA